MGAFYSVDTSDKKIVVIGGGYGGSYLAHKLLSKNIGTTTLVEPQEFSFHCIGALRASVDESYQDKLFIPFEGKLKAAHVKAKATSLDTNNNRVTLDNGDTIEYTDLVIATGSSCPFPGKLGRDNSDFSKQDVTERYAKIRNEIKSSKKVVIVGGGAVGVEMAGEIKTDFPDKNVTLINSRDFLVTNRAKTSFNTTLESALKEKMIDVLSNDRVENLNELQCNVNIEQVVKTKSGKEIECDLIISCVGTKINSNFYKEALGDAVNEMGALSVNEFFQVKGQENVYAIGDVTSIDEEKMAYTATQHAEYLFETLRGYPKAYNGSPFAMILPLGRNGGVGQFKGMILNNFMVKSFKSKDLFAGRMWGNLGLTPP